MEKLKIQKKKKSQQNQLLKDFHKFSLIVRQ